VGVLRQRLISAVDLVVRRRAQRLGRTLLELDYRPNDRNVPRYTEPHPGLERIIAAGEAGYAQSLAVIAGYAESLAAIDLVGRDAIEPSWSNPFLPGLDAAALYAALRSRQPARYLEIWSGNSTKFAARARRDEGSVTRITSIDPAPRSEIDALCDEVIRAPLEAAPSTVWESLAAGDVVFMDGSHRVFMNNDAVVFFLDIVPNLPAGVLVGIHDIFLPYDYPTEFADRYYSERYLLAAWLLGGAPVRITLPAAYVCAHMPAQVDELWRSSPELIHVPPHGGAFWFETSQAQ
jgi:hypothetical protein